MQVYSEIPIDDGHDGRPGSKEYDIFHIFQFINIVEAWT